MTTTLFIGLDGATFKLLDGFTSADAGGKILMPRLAELMKQGFSAPLFSTRHPLTPPAWVTLMTGRTPGHHGVQDFVRFDDRGDEVFFTLYDFRDIRVETLWSYATGQGRSVISLNFPMMAPPPERAGSIVPGFTSWKHLRRNVQPPELYERIGAMPGFDVRDLAWDFEREAKIGERMTDDELETWVRHHLPREAQWFRMAATLLEEDRPDFFAVMFDGVDKIQHQAWHLLDPACTGDFSSPRDQVTRALCHDYFARLDSYIGALVDLTGSDSRVFLASDHGFTASMLVVRINRFLGERGYLAWAANDGSEFARRREAANFAHLDWSQTRAFCPTPSSNGIYIRMLSPSFPQGVAPGEYLAFRRRLQEELFSWRDPETGEPVIAEAVPREDAFPGAGPGEAPDLLLVLADHGFVSVRNLEPSIAHRDFPAGTHHPEGIFVASGKDVSPAGRCAPMSIQDVTPTLVHSLGLPVPPSYEGRIPAGLFAAALLGPGTVPAHDEVMAWGGSTVQRSSGDDEMPEAERQHLLDQLRALGYLEE